MPSLPKVAYPRSWAELPWGEYYREALEHQLQPWWPKLFGFHLVKVGSLSCELATEKCIISHQVHVGIQGLMQVVADPANLPFATKSVDACLLCHTLAYTDDPHAILREADRILIDDGWLILSSFNPLSLLGIGKLIPVMRHRQPYCSRMFTQSRLLDWLKLLDYDILHQSRFQVFPWEKQGSGFLSTHLPALASLSLIVARKRTFSLPTVAFRRATLRPRVRGAVGATKSY